MQVEQIKERLWQAVAGLNLDMHNGIGSIQATLLHMLSGVWVWRTRWEGGRPTSHLAGYEHHCG